MSRNPSYTNSEQRDKLLVELLHTSGLTEHQPIYEEEPKSFGDNFDYYQSGRPAGVKQSGYAMAMEKGST